MKLNSITVTAPASVSNVGCGFDVMGFAINLVSDELTVSKAKNHTEIKIKKIEGDGGRLSHNIDENTCTIAIKSLLKSKKIESGLELVIRKKIGFGSGLGSSAASAVAGVYAVNKLLNLKLSKAELLDHAMVGESFASNAIHADNVAPSLLGGFVLIRSYNPIDIIKIDAPKNLYCTVIFPQIEIKTSEARKIISKSLPLKKAITQWGNTGALIAGLYKNDFELIGRSITDEVAEPKRSKLIPHYDEIKQAALNAGAYGCNISGSGPAIFALSNTPANAKKIGVAMKEVTDNAKLASKLFISKINSAGPKTIK